MIEIYTNKEIIEALLKKNGKEYQAYIWCEECSELVKSITKLMRNPIESSEINRYKYLKNNVIEETADVLICIEQIKAAFGITNKDIQEVVNLKQEREEKRYGTKK